MIIVNLVKKGILNFLITTEDKLRRWGWGWGGDKGDVSPTISRKLEEMTRLWSSMGLISDLKCNF